MPFDNAALLQGLPWLDVFQVVAERRRRAGNTRKFAQDDINGNRGKVGFKTPFVFKAAAEGEVLK